VLAALAIWTCRRCSAEFEPKAYQRARSDRTCRACKCIETKASRLKALAAGRGAIRSWKPSPERKRQLDREYFARAYADPQRRAKHAARVSARKAISSGKLIRRPCEVCGQFPVEAHHDDYGQPLNVRWLCPTHHRAHHAAERALARAA
jgi:hypothetical protein